MLKKTAYIALAFFVLVVGLFAYLFIAANNAERTLDKSIQEITEKSGSDLTISYSSIDVSPFSGDILFSDINIIRDQDIQRTGSARFDLSYGDFLNFMIWGTEAGLRDVKTGALELSAVSYTNRDTFLEIKADSLNINYSGNLWNLILLGVTQRPAEIQHDIKAEGQKFRYYQPEAGMGMIAADSMAIEAHFGNISASADSLYNSIQLSDITWTPPAAIQDQYEFFIQGFGYQTDSIPFRSAGVTFNYNSTKKQLGFEAIRLNSELFTISSQGDILIDPTQFNRSQLYDFSVRIHETSPRFQNFLQQAQKLMGFKLPGDGQQIQLQLTGTLAEPQFTTQP